MPRVLQPSQGYSVRHDCAMVQPSGVVTFLSTDIAESTARWERDPEIMLAALAAHDATLRNAIEGHDGWLFKHTGDGVVAAFSSPRSAVDAATEAQVSLDLPVRGIATGEAERRGATDGPRFTYVTHTCRCR